MPLGMERAARNIVLLFDGTGDWAGTDTTNVMKIYDLLDKDSQLVYYSGGVGTLGSPLAISAWKKKYLQLLDLATATSLRANVINAYTFLVNNYREGDKIYLFGFSRGAFTARLLAAFLYNFGLLQRQHLDLKQYLWQTISSFRSIEDFKRDAEMIKNDFSQRLDLSVEFMGLFDTVSSVGIFDRFRVFPYTDKNPLVKHIRHAVSIHEERNA